MVRWAHLSKTDRSVPSGRNEMILGDKALVMSDAHVWRTNSVEFLLFRSLLVFATYIPELLQQPPPSRNHP